MTGKHTWPKVMVFCCLLALMVGCAAAQPGQPRPPAKRLGLGLPYIQAAWVAPHRIGGLTHKTLCVQLDRPMMVLSSLQGWRQVRRVGNHYVPKQAWASLHGLSLPAMIAVFWQASGFETQDGALLITGADMDHLAIGRAASGRLKVVALVTAGVRSNAMRQGTDQGRFVEPGTINIIIMTSRRLSPRAMTRALITVTEAKTAALQDLDVRSAYQPLACQATGTGTDNIMVVQGAGAPAKLTGGHSKLGELIARATYQGVVRAIAKQNGITAGRSLLLRLAERKLTPRDLAGGSSCGAAAVRELLAHPELAGWLEQALALQDAWQRRQLGDLSAWRKQCRAVAAELGVKVRSALDGRDGPLVMAREVLLGYAAQRCAGRL